MEFPTATKGVLSKPGAEGNGHDMAKSTDISEELDDLAFRYLDIMQSIICEQDRLCEALSDGFVNMAKARYIMGNKSVSMLQINEGEMMPNCVVHTETDSYGAVEFTNFKIAEKCSQNIEKEKLRHRKVKNPDAVVDEMDNSVISEQNLENVEQKSGINPPGGKNPLQWFGVLVPKSLRACQFRFQESLPIATKVASLKSELLSVHGRYRELLAKEKEIQNNS